MTTASRENADLIDFSKKKIRFQWMDLIRGLAVWLVGIGHLAMFSGEHLEGDGRWFDGVADFTAGFRLQTLMFLSGMLLVRSLNKPAFRFLAGKVDAILWPLIIWTVVEKIRIAPDYDHLLNPIWMTKMTYLWYLDYILIFYIAALIFRKFPPPWVIPIVSFILMSVVGISSQLVFFTVFFWGGYYLATHGEWLQRITNSRWSLIWTPLMLATGAITAYGGYNVSRDWRMIPLEFASVFALITLGKIIQNTKFASIFSWFGRRSIVVYITHWPMLVMFFAASGYFGFDSFWMIIPAGIWMFFSVAIFCKLQDTAPVSWLFRFPREDLKAILKREK